MAKVYFDSLAISDSYKPLIVGDKDIVAGIKKVSSHKKDHSFKLAELKFGEQNVWMNNKDTHVVVDGQTFKTPTTIEGIQQGIDLGEWTEEDILTNIKDDDPVKYKDIIEILDKGRQTVSELIDKII